MRVLELQPHGVLLLELRVVREEEKRWFPGHLLLRESYRPGGPGALRIGPHFTTAEGIPMECMLLTAVHVLAGMGMEKPQIPGHALEGCHVWATVIPSALF